MKKKAIVIGSIVLFLAVITTAFCMNLFGCRDRTVRVLWNINHQSVSAQTMIQAVVEKNESTEDLHEGLKKIVFPKGAFVNAFHAEYLDPYQFQFQVIFPKDKTELFVDALANAGFTRWDTEFPPHKNFPQTFGPLSIEQISYIFDMVYGRRPSAPDVYVRGVGRVYIYIIESEEQTIAIIDVS